jgi:hypothetical protein
MAEPLTAAAIGSVIVSALKEVGKTIFNHAKKAVLTLWDNKWILIIAGTSSGIFLYYYNMLHSWFGFPPILNTAILGIFALTNFTWVVSYWKSSNDNSSSKSEPKVSVS